MNFPSALVEKVSRFFGDEGEAWLADLPNLLERCRAKWDLHDTVMAPFMSINYIEFAATPDGEPVALKVGVPHPELFTEMEALSIYAERGTVPLIDADRDLGAILMRRLQPGTMLWELGDDSRETAIAASVIQNLHVPVPAQHSVPPFSAWVERAFRLTRIEWDPGELMPRDLIDAAEQAFREITGQRDDLVVLHGDLHHENILLDDQSGWTVIDPKGAVGPKCLEVGRFLHNRLPSEGWQDVMRERIRIFSSELGYSGRTIAACGLVDRVLSRCWSLEDGHVSDDWPVSIEQGRFCQSMWADVSDNGPFLAERLLR
jgi:streptomycin 6-kinase